MNQSDQYQTLVKELLKWHEEITEKDKTAKKIPYHEEYPPIRNFKEITLTDKPTLQKLQTLTTPRANELATKENVADSSIKIEEQVSAAEKREKRKQNAIIEKDRGNEHFKKGEFEQAIHFYSKSIELDPLNAVFPINRAMAYLKLQRYPEAEKDCTLGLGIDPNNLKALWRRGIARRNMGKLVEAKQDLEKALKIEATNQAVKNELRLTTDALKTQEKSKSLANADKSVPRRRLEIEEIDADEDIITPINTKYTPRNEAATIVPLKSVPLPDTSGGIIGDKITTQTPLSNSEKSSNPEPLKHSPLTNVRVNDSNSLHSEVTAKPLPQFTPPKTTLEFERQWKTYRNDSAKLYHYFKCIEPKNYSNIFKSSLESSYMTKIIELLKTFYIKSDSPSLIVDVLKNLSQVKRFDMITMFMSSSDKQTLQEIFCHLKESTALEDLRPLIRAYKVNIQLD